MEYLGKLAQLSKNRILPVFLAACLFIYLPSCESINTPESFYTHSVLFNLIANRGTQECFVSRTTGLCGRSIDVSEPDAEVSVTDPEGHAYPFKARIDTLAPDLIGSIYVSTSPIWVAPGQSYRLSVKTKEEIITGETVVPEDFSILAPSGSDKFRVVNGTLRFIIAWTKSENAKGYVVKVTISYITSWGDAAPHKSRYSYFIDTQDTTWTFSTTAPAQSDSCSIEVLAYDKNYYNYKHLNAQSSGISGGYGYFASSVLKSVKVGIVY
ncbi:MAG: DUF4249 family protein [Bacteroidota bacterium]